MENETNYKLSDEVIAHVAQLLQLAILTGTDVVDNLRMIRLSPLGEGLEALQLTNEYKKNADTEADTDIKVEGVIKVDDPVSFNDSVSDLDDSKSPGVFINSTRAFSSDNNPWEELGSVAFGTQWNDWEVNWTGSFTEAQFRQGNQIGTVTSRIGSGTRTGSGSGIGSGTGSGSGSGS